MRVSVHPALLSLSLAAGLMLSGGPARAGDQDFSMDNQTGYQIDEVHVSAKSANSWGPDILGKTQTFDNGTTLKITFAPNATACSYDLQVVYHDGTKAEWGGLDLCSINKVTVYYNRGSGETRAVTE